MTTLKVPDMTCQHCVATITKLIQQQDPAAQVQTDLALHTVSEDSLISLLEDAGYTPSNL